MDRIPNIQSFCSGNINSGNVWNNYNNNITLNGQAITVNATEDEDNKIKQWLSSLEPQGRHQSVQANRVDGVGGWFLESDEFGEWSGSRGVTNRSILFCYGHPGVGKTHLRSVRKLSYASGYH